MADTKRKLDLDILLPEPHEVILGGKTHEVRPLRLKEFIRLLKLFGRFQSLNKVTNDVSAIEEIEKLSKAMEEALYPIIPALKEENMDLSFEQLDKLVGFIMTISSDLDRAALEAEGIKITEKKTSKVQESSEESPTSSESTQDTPSANS